MNTPYFDPSIPIERREELTALLEKIRDSLVCTAVIPEEERNLRIRRARFYIEMEDENKVPIHFSTDDFNVLLFLEGTPESQQHQAWLERELDEEIKFQQGDYDARTN
jgi:hypothetical protein